MVLCCVCIGVVVILCFIFLSFDLFEDNEDTDQSADYRLPHYPAQPAGPSSGSGPPATMATSVVTSTSSQSQSITGLPVTFTTRPSRKTTLGRRTTTIASTSKGTKIATTTQKIATTTTTRSSVASSTAQKITAATTTRKSITTTTTQKSTTTTTRKSTPSSTTRKSTMTSPITTTKYVPQKTPGTPKPIPFYPLICTMDCIKTIHPIEDGLCDFLFFESLYRLCGGEILEPQLSVALKLFVGFAKGASKTEYGVSIDASNIQDFTKHLKIPDALAWVDTQLWQNKVCHWGIMTIHEFHQRTKPDILKDALAALNAAALFSQRSPTKNIESYTFIGFYELNHTCDTIGKYATSFFTPSVMVVLGHVAFYENKVPGFSLQCYVIPPNCFEPPAALVHEHRLYIHTVEDAALQLSCLRQRYNISIPICVSLTLQGRWYEPSKYIDGQSTKGKYVYNECNVKSFTQQDDPLEICDRPGVALGKNVAFDMKARSVVYFDDNPNSRRTFIFDNSFSLQYKACVMKRQNLNVPYSLAAYHVNFDSGPSSCDKRLLEGKYTRTKLLKKVADFIAHNYTKRPDINTCRKVT